MHKPSIGLSLEGMPFIFLTTVATLTFALIGCWPMAVLLLTGREIGRASCRERV